MANVTLIGIKQAKKGNKFLFRGPVGECRDCKVKLACNNLEEGRSYEITVIRSMKHECKVHEEGTVKAVEYNLLPLMAGIDSSKAQKGSMITFTFEECFAPGCEHYHTCHDPGLKIGTQYKIAAVGRKLNCLIGRSLNEVNLE